jgi:hypothetical protein
MVQAGTQGARTWLAASTGGRRSSSATGKFAAAAGYAGFFLPGFLSGFAGFCSADFFIALR